MLKPQNSIYNTLQGKAMQCNTIQYNTLKCNKKHTLGSVLVFRSTKKTAILKTAVLKTAVPSEVKMAQNKNILKSRYDK